MRCDPNLKRWFRLINKKFFHGELPNNVVVRWAVEADCNQDFAYTQKLSGGQHKYLIVIDRAKNEQLTTLLNTLAHEMTHMATEFKDDHGPAFSRWHELLTKRGMFRKGALRKGLTLF